MRIYIGLNVKTRNNYKSILMHKTGVALIIHGTGGEYCWLGGENASVVRRTAGRTAKPNAIYQVYFMRYIYSIMFCVCVHYDLNDKVIIQ